MNSVVFLILRRMRPPLLVLIITYAIAVLGLVLVPGVDAQGNPWHLDFFHAFYFVSYMATTIGFGEIPYEFTAAQRLWTLVCIYLTVVAWFYAIGTLVALVQDRALRQTVTERRFARTVRRLREPFYLVCGYGDTGTALVDGVAAQHRRAVVVDIDSNRIDALILKQYPVYVPGLCADAGLPDTLLAAGLKSRRCLAVVALTNHDEVNLHIAMTSKLLNPGLKVICRGESKDIEDNMASFHTNHIIDPFETFADRLFTALHSPCRDVLHQWLTGASPLIEPLSPPHGLWVLCGYGRFGKALYKRLQKEGVPTTVIEPAPELTGWPEGAEGCVKGWGTGAVTLRRARAAEAVGIVAGTAHDTNNLSILMTAGYVNPDLFMVTRQNRQSNRALFEAIQADIVAQGSQTIAERIRTLLNVPLLVDFLTLARGQGDGWAREVMTRLGGVLGEKIPEVWELTITERESPTVVATLNRDETIALGELIRDPREREQRLPIVPLLFQRLGEQTILPEDDIALRLNDRILFCGILGMAARARWILQNPTTLTYIRTGSTEAQTFLWRWFRRWAQRPQ